MRISKKDKAEYNRLKKNVQSKIKRVQKNNNLDLSGLIELPPLESFTRKDFNLWKEEAKKFSSRVNKVRHNEYGVPYTNQLVKEYQRKAEKQNKLREQFNEKYKDLPFLTGGKETRMTVELRNLLLKSPDVLGNLTEQKFDINEIKDIRGLERRMKSIDKFQRLEDYHSDINDMRENWITMLQVGFNSTASNRLMDKILGLSPEVFYEIYLAHSEMSFEEIYEAMDSEDYEHIAKLESYIDQYLQGNHPQLLVGFPNKF